MGDNNLSSSTGEFLGDEEEEALETLEIEEADDLPLSRNFEDAKDLSTCDSVSLV